MHQDSSFNLVGENRPLIGCNYFLVSSIWRMGFSSGVSRWWHLPQIAFRMSKDDFCFQHFSSHWDTLVLISSLLIDVNSFFYVRRVRDQKMHACSEGIYRILGSATELIESLSWVRGNLYINSYLLFRSQVRERNQLNSLQWLEVFYMWYVVNGFRAGWT